MIIRACYHINFLNLNSPAFVLCLDFPQIHKAWFFFLFFFWTDTKSITVLSHPSSFFHFCLFFSVGQLVLQVYKMERVNWLSVAFFILFFEREREKVYCYESNPSGLIETIVMIILYIYPYCILFHAVQFEESKQKLSGLGNGYFSGAATPLNNPSLLHLLNIFSCNW